MRRRYTAPWRNPDLLRNSDKAWIVTQKRKFVVAAGVGDEPTLRRQRQVSPERSLRRESGAVIYTQFGSDSRALNDRSVRGRRDHAVDSKT